MEVFVAMVRNSGLYPKGKGKVPENCKHRGTGRICIWKGVLTAGWRQEKS